VFGPSGPVKINIGPKNNYMWRGLDGYQLNQTEVIALVLGLCVRKARGEDRSQVGLEGCLLGHATLAQSLYRCSSKSCNRTAIDLLATALMQVKLILD
jgi:hypothetical protein